MFLGFQANPPEINKNILISGGLAWNPKNIENTQSFIWFFNEKHKKHWKHTVFYMIFQSKTYKTLKTHSLLYVFVNWKYTNDWKHTVFSWFSIYKSEQSLLKQKKLEFLSSHKLRPMSYERLQNGFVGFVLFLVAVVQPRTRGAPQSPRTQCGGQTSRSAGIFIFI